MTWKSRTVKVNLRWQKVTCCWSMVKLQCVLFAKERPGDFVAIADIFHGDLEILHMLMQKFIQFKICALGSWIQSIPWYWGRWLYSCSCRGMARVLSLTEAKFTSGSNILYILCFLYYLVIISFLYEIFKLWDTLSEFPLFFYGEICFGIQAL